MRKLKQLKQLMRLMWQYDTCTDTFHAAFHVAPMALVIGTLVVEGSRYRYMMVYWS